MKIKKLLKPIIAISLVSLVLGCEATKLNENLGEQLNVNNATLIVENKWETIEAKGDIVARHEAGLIGINNNLYLLGGRRINPVNVFNVSSKTWETKSKSPIEMHHFQPVTFNNKIYIIGAMTGRYPGETPLQNVIIYDPAKDLWSEGDEIPENRRRGGAGVTLFNNKIYISGGITDGHRTGTVTWFDEYNPVTGEWRILDDMPNGRDHFQSTLIDNKLYAAGGRTTSQITKQVFDLVVNALDIYDFDKHTWTTHSSPLPTGRAGNTTTTVGKQVWVIGGESVSNEKAHKDVEIYDTLTQQWLTGPTLNRGRHGTGAVIIDNQLWTASGSGNRGGSPELKSIEKLAL